MDIKINRTAHDGQYLEYNAIGGIIDLHFLAGPSPFDVAKQAGELFGLPTMQPYFGLGLHQCKYGMSNVFHVAEVVANYSKAGIPLETMWSDIVSVLNQYSANVRSLAFNQQEYSTH